MPHCQGYLVWKFMGLWDLRFSLFRIIKILWSYCWTPIVFPNLDSPTNSLQEQCTAQIAFTLGSNLESQKSSRAQWFTAQHHDHYQFNGKQGNCPLWCVFVLEPLFLSLVRMCVFVSIKKTLFKKVCCV